jgi:hypothetical protein
MSQSEAAENSGRSPWNWFEVVATGLLALATVATAWSGYQATRWGAEATKESAASNRARFAASRAADRANTQTQIDVSTFIAWADAYARDEQALEDFYFERFRDEFKPAVEAWIATNPQENPDAPLTPFAMEEYVLEERLEAERQDEVANEATATMRRNLQRQSNYVLAVVLFATALFFAGMSTRVTMRDARLAILAGGCIVFVGTLLWLATFPVTVNV